MRALLAGAPALLLALAVAPAASADEVAHFTRIEDAVAAAKGRDIIVDFTGSDWCGWCIRLVNEVFSQPEWQAAAKDKFVFVELDFPRKKEQDAATKAYNQRLQNIYGVTGFPSIFVLDAQGRPYAKTGYKAGGPAAYLAHLAELAAQKTAIADLEAAVAAATPETRLATIGDAIAKLDSFGVTFGYVGLKEQAIELDADNAAGKRLAYARELAKRYLAGEDVEKGTKYLEVVRGLDPAAATGVEVALKLDADVVPLLRTGDWAGGLVKLQELADTTGEAGQQVWWYITVCHARLKDPAKALEAAEKALALAPDSKLATQIKRAIAQFSGQ